MNADKRKKKINLKANDNVVVINGADKGRRGKILFLDRDRGRVVVEGINKKHKHIKPSQEFPKGGIIDIERWIDISNVMFFCEKCKKGVKIGARLEDKSRSRICKKCGKSIS